jgi:uncharacterized spore protein YtfJ
MTQLERIQQTIESARDAITVRRVYGEPIECDGAVVIPAADVRGGGGGGGGLDMSGNVGGGSGFGLRARPVGAFVMREGDVEWVPVIDRDRERAIIATVAALAFLTVRSLTRRPRGKRR